MRMFKHDHYVEFRIPKVEAELWPRLTVRQQKLHWLQLDWERTSLDDSDSEKEKEQEERETDERFKQTLREVYSTNREEEIKEMKETLEYGTVKTYLICYNCLLWCLFTYVFIVTLRMILVHKSEATQYLYPAIASTLILAEGIQGLEILHTLLGWSKGTLMFTVLQNLGRFLFLFIVVAPHQSAHVCPPLTMVCLAWSAIEVVRYPFYTLQLLNLKLEFMTWLRYTAWIPLYPTGILSEILTLVYTLPEIDSKKIFDLELPNKFNVSFNLGFVLRIYVILVTFYFAPQQFYHMYRQTMRKLGLDKKRAKQKEE